MRPTWSAVYSYAFEPGPRHWDATDWPRGLRDHIEASAAYLGEVLAWFDRTYERWLASLAGVDDLDAARPGSTARRSRRTTSPPSATACVRPG
jgi:hypothetical protein